MEDPVLDRLWGDLSKILNKFYDGLDINNEMKFEEIFGNEEAKIVDEANLLFY